MSLIPQYQFTTVTAAPSNGLVDSLATGTAATQVPVDGVVVADTTDVVRLLLVFGVVVLLVIGALGVLASWIVAGRVLRPLSTLNEAARGAAEGKFDQRVALDAADDEFRELGDTFDFMLDSLERSFDANERFAANASHELRTPLTTVKVLIDGALARPQSTATTALLTKLASANDRTVGIVDALLDLSDVTAAPLTRSPHDVRSLVARAVAEVSPIAVAREVNIIADVPTVAVWADVVLLERAVANLVRNGVQHNETGGTVWITVADEQGTVRIRIENTGAVVDAATASSLAEPFYRVAGRIATGGAGVPDSHGLGLALVSRIVDAHGGRFEIRPRTRGGLVVDMTMPGPTR
ncbi:hypothetical protein GCM10027413_24860 [Conyzicola nivalis]|uniref:histidine kinase n=1 Tax=Conyzicola nivalis TaxID=1477021 RepID=A0A916SA08_9MICO|nr:HAMP domain-containing sensor histidine kinase [Conyzicola nivalis]GGA90706.1 hypothetical protein GCM10010979_01760 [Conyzicola nivalis]